MVSSEDTRIREDGKNTGPDGDLTEGAARAGGVEAAEVNPDSEKAEKEQRRVGLRPAGMQVRRKGLPVSRCSAPLLYAGPHDEYRQIDEKPGIATALTYLDNWQEFLLGSRNFLYPSALYPGENVSIIKYINTSIGHPPVVQTTRRAEA
jgi:hypothetical protein